MAIKRYCDSCGVLMHGLDCMANVPSHFTLKTQASAPYVDLKVSVVTCGCDLCVSCLKQVIDGRWTSGPNVKGHPTNGMG